MNDTGSSITSSSSSLDDAELCELRERVELVERYDKGDHEDQKVDEWENPNFEVYTKADRYGFMSDEANERDLIEERIKELELKREGKWIKMIANWEKYEKTVKLRKRIFKGIPEKFRTTIWGRLLKLKQVRQPGVYEQLRLRARLLSKDLKQIDLDINRTYRNHVFFRRRYDEKQRDLFHVLAAYAIYNTQVGYCQGMSQIAAVLLMYFSEEDAFWALQTIMCDQAHSMNGFFVPGFPKLFRFQQHHDKILEKLLPKLKRHFDKVEVHSTLYTTKWFFQCFLDRVPFSLALRLWDNFILDGDIVLTGAAYCIIKLHQKTLIRCNFEQAMDLLQAKLERSFGYHPDEVIKQVREAIAELRRHRLSKPHQPVDAAELPPSNLGAVLLQPIDDVVRRAASSVLSRKFRRSRQNSASFSVPTSPQTRISPMMINGSAAANGPHRPSRPPPAAVTTIFVQSSTNDVITRRPPPSPSPDYPSDAEDYREERSGNNDQREEQSVNDDRLSNRMRHVLSVYDNVGLAEQFGNAMGVAEQQIRGARRLPSVDSVGSPPCIAATAKTSFASSYRAANLTSPLRPTAVRVGANHITTVEIDSSPSQPFYNNANPKSMTSSPSQHNDVWRWQNDILETTRQSNNSLLGSNKPAKFPIVQTNYDESQ